MRRTLWTAALALGLGGCATGPLQENPLLLRPERLAARQNPVFLPLGPESYGMVYEKVLDILGDYFEIDQHSRYDGVITTFPRTAPGIGQPWKPGSPDFYQRLLASFQSIRYRAVVQIQAEENGGYFIDVKVFKELEDLPSPTRDLERRSMAAFRSEIPTARQFEIVDETTYEGNWIPVGREYTLEQVILERIAQFK
jgi:hypothetical protein